MSIRRSSDAGVGESSSGGARTSQPSPTPDPLEFFASQLAAGSYFAMQANSGFPYYRPATALWRQIGLRAGDPVLEIGAGTRESTRALFDVQPSIIVTATEPSASMRAILKHIFDQDNLSQGMSDAINAYQLPDKFLSEMPFTAGLRILGRTRAQYRRFHSALNVLGEDALSAARMLRHVNEFDLVVGHEVLHWLGIFNPNPSYEHECFSAFHNILRSGGKVAFSTPYELFASQREKKVRTSLASPFVQKFTNALMSGIQDIGNQTPHGESSSVADVQATARRFVPYNEEILTRMLDKAGFQNVRFAVNEHVISAMEVAFLQLGNAFVKPATHAAQLGPALVARLLEPGRLKELVHRAFEAAWDHADPLQSEATTITHCFVMADKK